MIEVVGFVCSNAGPSNVPFIYLSIRRSAEIVTRIFRVFGAALATEYHRSMKIPWAVVAGWFHGVLLAFVPWMAWWRAEWALVLAAAGVKSYRPADRTRAAEPWSSMMIAVSSLVFLSIRGGWEVMVGWLLLSALAALVGRLLPRRAGRRPDVADCLAVGGWGVAFALAPRLVDMTSGGWLAPATLLFSSQRLARTTAGEVLVPEAPGPPDREVRGTVSLDGVVLRGPDGLPRSVPLDLELRAGDSLAVLCDAPDEAGTLAAVLSGRQAPHAGEMTLDGSPLTMGTRLVAVVAPGESFVDGAFIDNLAVLCDAPLDRNEVAALHDACSLNEVTEALGDRTLADDGSPLYPFHRLLVLAARVIPSSYHVVVVVDPMPWVNAVRGELWRSAVVRASVGRTAIWLTPDRDLASRASYVLEFRQGALRRAN